MKEHGTGPHGRPKELLTAKCLGWQREERLFADVSFNLHPGDLIEIRGPNGSGKSTLLRMLAGLLPSPGATLRHHAPVAYLGHRPGGAANMSPVENVRWATRLQGHPTTAAQAEAALKRLGLGAERFRPCGTLSAGQQRRAAWGRLLAAPQSVWLLDEPLAALDAAGEDLVRTLIAEHRRADGAIVCATHSPVATPSAPATASITLPM